MSSIHTFGSYLFNTTLDCKLTFSPSIQPVCLPKLILETPAPLAETFVTVVGWGRGNHDEHSAKIVRIDITITSDKECDLKYENAQDWKSKTRIEN